MNTISRPVVVGIDPNGTSDLALDWAAIEAVRRGRPLHIVHAYAPLTYPAIRPGMTPGGIAGLDDSAKEVATQVVTISAERVRSAHPHLLVEAFTRSGPPGTTLIDASHDAELVVVGARGRGAVKGMVFGSVSIHLCAHAHAPVVVVHEAASRSITDARVVVGVDGSETSQAALAFGFAQASSRGVGLTVVHTWQVDGVEGTAASLAWSVDWAQLGEEERSVVAEALAGFGELYPDVDVRRHVTQGSPIEELGRLSQGACLLVVGTRGRGTVAGWLKGSVSQSVLRAAHCPVAVVHPTPCADTDPDPSQGHGERHARYLAYRRSESGLATY